MQEEGFVPLECLGCRIANGVEPGLNIVFENSIVTCVLDIAPFNEGHLLILPKKHIVELDELDPTVANEIFSASIALARIVKAVFKPDGITVCQNGGAFNDLKHYHIHLIPRYEGDGFKWGEPVRQDGAEHRLTGTKQKFLKALTD